MNPTTNPDYIELSKVASDLTSQYGLKLTFKRPIDSNTTRTLGTVMGVAIKITEAPLPDGSGSEFNMDDSTFIIPSNMSWAPDLRDLVYYTDFEQKQAMMVVYVEPYAPNPGVALAYKVTIR